MQIYTEPVVSHGPSYLLTQSYITRLRVAFPKHLRHGKVPVRILKSTNMKVSAVVPRAAAPAEDITLSACTNG